MADTTRTTATRRRRANDRSPSVPRRLNARAGDGGHGRAPDRGQGQLHGDRQLAAAFEAVRQANQDLGKIVRITLNTRVPEKYRIFDLETGDVWASDAEGNLKRSTDLVILTRKEVMDWQDAVQTATGLVKAMRKSKVATEIRT